MSKILALKSLLLRWVRTSGTVHGWEYADPNPDGVPVGAMSLDMYARLYTHYPAGGVQSAAPDMWLKRNFNQVQAQNAIAPGASITATFNFTTTRPCNLEVIHEIDVGRNNPTSGTSTQATATNVLKLDNVTEQTTPINFPNRGAASNEERNELISTFEENSLAAGAHSITSVFTNSSGVCPMNTYYAYLHVFAWPIGVTYDINTAVLL